MIQTADASMNYLETSASPDVGAQSAATYGFVPTLTASCPVPYTHRLETSSRPDVPYSNR